MSKHRDDLPPMPARMARLPVDYRGFPVPWFVQWLDGDKPSEAGVGVPDFRVADWRKIGKAVKERRCWCCGGQLGAHLAFVIGPMCAVNRTISEPPSHLECAEFSARGCPFLSRPRMRRNEKDLPEDRVEAAGFGLKRNPGVACVWVTRSYQMFRADAGGEGVLFRLGIPERVLWFAEGREATREEVMASIESGYPSLHKAAEEEGPKALAELRRLLKRVELVLPTNKRPSENRPWII